jgi:hypothetical protein
VTFTRFAAIDWSGAAGARQKGIAVAVAEAGDEPPRLVRPDRIWSRAEVLDWMAGEIAAGPVLIGLDLSPALAFADCGAFFPGWARSPDDARGLWALVEEIAADEPHLGANRFVDHPQASRHFRRHGGRCGDLFPPGSGRFRVVEAASRAQGLCNPYSNFNLVGAAQVGKASLTGMRLFHRLDGRVPIWPYDPAPAAGPVVVEIYTSIAATAAGLPRGRTKIRDAATLDRALAALGSRLHGPLPRADDHATDALLAAAWLRANAADPGLWQPAGLTPGLARTEGWTFGVR